MSKQPIIEFKDEAQAYECLKEWQSRLFLDDWIIKLSLVDSIDENEEFTAINNKYKNFKTSHIEIRKHSDEADDVISKYCHELSLLHELLHCKIDTDSDILEIDSIERYYLFEANHALIEQMAKSLIMAKYDLPFEWFKNF